MTVRPRHDTHHEPHAVVWKSRDGYFREFKRDGLHSFLDRFFPHDSRDTATGEGKTKEGDFRTTVFKRELDQQYNLKMKNARAFFNEVNKKYPTLPFSISSFED